jgi:hypothetical protein
MAKSLHRLYPADNAAASDRALAAHQAPQRQVGSGRAILYEGLRLVGGDAFPPERLLQMRGEGLLDQPVLAVDAGEGYALSARLRLRGSRLRGRLAIFDQLAVAYHHRGGASLPRDLPDTPGGAEQCGRRSLHVSTGQTGYGLSFHRRTRSATESWDPIPL